MKLLITGVTGLMGHAIAQAAIRRRHQVIGVSYQQVSKIKELRESHQINLDSSDPITRLCLDLWPDAIVNAAAISEPARVDAEPELAQTVNVALPRWLAQISTHIGARLVHLSTDMVFDGEVGGYASTDLPLPRSLYGQQKLMAEREVLEHNPEDPCVLRITLVNGNSPGGQRSVHEKLLGAIAKGQRPKLFEDELRQPCSAENTADAVVELCERRNLHGIFHWAGADTLSRYALGLAILKRFRLPAECIEPACAADDPAHKDRPRNLTFNLHPLLGKLKARPDSLESQLDELRIPVPLIHWHREHRLPPQ